MWRQGLAIALSEPLLHARDEPADVENGEHFSGGVECVALPIIRHGTLLVSILMSAVSDDDVRSQASLLFVSPWELAMALGASRMRQVPALHLGIGR